MTSDSTTSINLTWTDPDSDLSDKDLQDSILAMIKAISEVSDTQIFPISEHELVFRIESESPSELIVEASRPAFGPTYEIQTIDDPSGENTLFRVVPLVENSDSASWKGSGNADSDPNKISLNPARLVLSGFDVLVGRVRIFAGQSIESPDSPWTRRTTLLAVLLSLLVWFMLPPVFSFTAIPWGVDQWGHLTRLELLRAAVADTGTIPMWLPHWYMGQDLWQYYPPLVYFVLLPTSLIAGNALDGYTMAVAPLTALTLVAMLWAFRPWLGNFGASVSGLLYVLSPVGLWPFFGVGHVPWGLQQMIMALNIGLLLRVLVNPTPRRLIFYGLTFGLMIIAHSMLALITGLATIPLVLGIWATGGTNFKNISIAGATAILGVGTVAIWMIPGITHIDLAGVPSLSPEKVGIWSGSPLTFDRNLAIESFSTSGAASRFLGFSIPFIAIISGAISVISPRHRTLGVGLITMSIVMFVIGQGLKTPFWNFVPFDESLLPNRAYNLSMLGMTVLIGLGFKLLVPMSNLFFTGLKNRHSRLNLATVGLIIFTVVLAAEYMPWWVERSPENFTGEAVIDDLIQLPEERWIGGRYWDFTPVNDSYQNYTVTVEANRQSVLGWAAESTIHAEDFNFIGSDIRNRQLTGIVRKADIFNVEYIWMLKQDADIIEAFEDVGFTTADESQFRILMRAPTQGGYVFDFNKKVLGIGRDANLLASVIPDVTVGNQPYLADYDSDFLDWFDTIVIAAPGLEESPQELGEWIDERLDSGQRVVIDPATSGATVATNISLTPTTFSGSHNIVLADGTSITLGPFDSSGEPYITQTPIDLAIPGPVIPSTVGAASLYASEPRGNGELIVLPFAYVLHVYSNNSNAGDEWLMSSILQTENSTEYVPYPRIASPQVSGGESTLKMNFDKPEAGYVMLSMSFSPHWSATVNGESVKVIRHENMNIIPVQAGHNEIELDYKSTTIQLVSGFASLVSLIALFGVAIYGRRLIRISSINILSMFRVVLVQFPNWLFTEEKDESPPSSTHEPEDDDRTNNDNDDR